MCWMKDREKIEEPLLIFFFCDRRRVFYIQLLLTIESGYISRISNANNRDFHLAKHQPWAAQPNRPAVPSIWLNHKGIVHYELLNQGETYNGYRYLQQQVILNIALFKKWTEWPRHKRVILFHDNIPCYWNTIVQDTTKTLKYGQLWKYLYSPHLAPVLVDGAWFNWNTLRWFLRDAKLIGSIISVERFFTLTVFLYCQREGKNK